MKRFKIASVSSNIGAFGHRGYILIGPSGEAWEVQRTFNRKPTWEKGQVVEVSTVWHDGYHLQWASMGVECPRRLPNPPEAVLDEVWGDKAAKPKPNPRPILELVHNGDPFGGGFTARESKDDGETWFHRGGIGARTRQWWRQYARRHGYRLREATGQYNLRAEKNRATTPA